MLSRQQDVTEHSRIGDLDGAEDNKDEDEDEDEPVSRGRPRRATQQSRVKAKHLFKKHTEGYNSLGSMDDESDMTSSGIEWDEEDEDEPDDRIDDEEEDEDADMSDNSGAGEEEDDPLQSLVVSLRYKKSRPSPPSQDPRNGLATFEDHSILKMTTDNSKGPPETAYSTDGLTKSLKDAPKPTQDAAPNQYSRSTHQSAPISHAVLTESAAPAQYAAPTNPRPQVGHPGQSIQSAPEQDHNAFQSNRSQPEEHPAPTTSWPRTETGVVAPNGTQM